MLKRDDVIDWLESPVTRAYFTGIKAKIREVEQQLGRGVTLDSENPHATVVQTARLVGLTEAYKDVLEVNVDEVVEGDE